MKRVSIAFIACLALILLPACSDEEESAFVRLALQTEPATLDPAYSVDYSSGMLSSLVHANLVRYTPEGELVPDLARRWEISPDGMKYTFHLAPALFSCGRRVRALDVLFSFERLLAPGTVSPRWWVLGSVLGAEAYHGGGIRSIPGVEARDDSTVIIRLQRPASHFLGLLAMPAAGIVCREDLSALGDRYARSPCGGGPWRLAEWREAEEIVLVRNERYQGRKPLVEGISFRIIPETMTRIAEFEVGNLDLLEVPRAELDLWRSAGPPLLETEELRIVYIGLNNARPPFDDVRVRRALNMAVDTETIIAHVLFGGATKAKGVVPAALRGSPHPVDLYPFDPDGAMELLAEAGYPDGFEMEIWQRENPEGGRILESVQAYLGRVGVRARLVTREWSAFKQAVERGTPDAFYLDWFADYPDPENFLVPLFHSSNRGGGGNRSNYENGEVDSLLDEAALCGDPAERWELCRGAEEIVYRDAPWIFLWFPTRYEIVSPRLRGYRIPVIFNGQRFLDVSF
jgi:ABC-type transport system substrate-binding protein